MKVSALTERHKTLGEGTKTLGLCFRRLNRLVGEKSNREVREQEALVSGSASEAGSLRGLRHCVLLFDARNLA